MAYDEDLAARIRLLTDGLAEKRMFGGLAFLVGGNMAVVASGQGGLMVRVPPADSEAWVARPGASRMVMRGKEMRGWLRVTSEAVQSDEVLAEWVRTGVDHARTLPAK